MSLPKVLVATTIYEGKDYIIDRYYKNLLNLSYPNYDILLVDNSRDNKYKKELVRRGYNVVHVSRGKHSREGVANGLNYIRKYALNHGYDYWMSIECDLIPPRDIIERLMLHQKTIIGCIYVIGYQDSKNQPPRPCLFGLGRKKDTGELHTFNYTPKEGFEFFGTGLREIHGCGLGCTLVKTDLLKKIEFWYMDADIKHSDVYMYMDLHNMGHSVYLDSDIIIPHYNSKWDIVPDI